MAVAEGEGGDGLTASGGHGSGRTVCGMRHDAEGSKQGEPGCMGFSETKWSSRSIPNF